MRAILPIAHFKSVISVPITEEDLLIEDIVNGGVKKKVLDILQARLLVNQPFYI